MSQVNGFTVILVVSKQSSISAGIVPEPPVKLKIKSSTLTFCIIGVYVPSWAIIAEVVVNGCVNEYGVNTDPKPLIYDGFMVSPVSYQWIK